MWQSIISQVSHKTRRAHKYLITPHFVIYSNSLGHHSASVQLGLGTCFSSHRAPTPPATHRSRCTQMRMYTSALHQQRALLHAIYWTNLTRAPSHGGALFTLSAHALKYPVARWFKLFQMSKQSWDLPRTVKIVDFLTWSFYLWLVICLGWASDSSWRLSGRVDTGNGTKCGRFKSNLPDNSTKNWRGNRVAIFHLVQPLQSGVGVGTDTSPLILINIREH